MDSVERRKREGHVFAMFAFVVMVATGLFVESFAQGAFSR